MTIIVGIAWLYPTPTSAQPGLSVIRRFQHSYGSTFGSEHTQPISSGGTANCCHPLERTKSGDYIMVGTQFPSAGSQIMTVRAGITGAQIGTARSYVSGSRGTVGTDIQAARDGGFAILGFEGMELTTGDPSAFPGDIVLIKTDGSGTLLWKKQYGNAAATCREQAFAITQTSDNGYMVAGYVECPPGPIMSYGDILLMKLDAYGNIQWHKEYNDYHWNYVAQAVQQTADGGYIVAGKLSKYAGGIQAFMMKVTGDGTVQWFKEFGTPATTDEFQSVATTDDGGYIATGRLGNDIYIVRLSATGVLVWANTYAGAGGVLDVGYDIKRQGAKYLVAGLANNAKAFLMRIQGTGAIDFAKAYAPPGATSVARSVVATDQGYAISGDVSTNATDFYLVKTDGNGDSYCNTENLVLSIATQPDESPIIMLTPPHDIVVTDRINAGTPAINQAQLCYKEDSAPILPNATIGDVAYAHAWLSGIIVDNDGHINDPVAEPLVTDGHVWSSDAIWLRTSADEVNGERPNGHLYLHELMNESPRFDLGTNYIYTLITNNGDAATDAATLEVYWSLASTNLEWPTHWSNYRSGGEGPHYGDLAGTVEIPVLEPGESYVAEIPWTTPSPNDYGGTTPPVSFLARYVSATDPMAFQEGLNTAANAINNNNVAWRNVVIVNGNDMGGPNGQVPVASKAIVIRSTQEASAGLTFSIPSEEVEVNPLFTQANVYVDLGPTLYQQWVENDRPGTNIEDQQDGTIRITGDQATIGLSLPANSETSIGIRFTNIGPALSYPEFYHYDVSQAGGIGGVTFELQFPVLPPLPPGSPKVVPHSNTSTAGIVGGVLAAHPNPSASSTTISFRIPVTTKARLAIYDIAGNLVRVLVANDAVTTDMHNVPWDGRDATGRPVGTGVYLCRLETPLGILSRQLTIVR